MTSELEKRLLDGIKNAGRSEVIAASVPPLNFPPPVTLINLNGSDSEAVPVTVYLFATRENKDDAEPTVFRPYLVADIEWGTDGLQLQAQVDFTRGLAFSLCTSFLRVKVSLDRAAFLGVNPAPAEDIRAGATVAYGTRPGHLSSPTRTLWFRTVGAGVTTPPQLLPPFAREVTLAWQSTVSPTPAYRIDILDSALFVVATREVGGAGFGAGTQQIPLPGDARFVRVFNPLGAPLQDFRVTCGLAF